MYPTRSNLLASDGKSYPNFYDFNVWFYVPIEDIVLVVGWAFLLTFLRVYVQSYFKKLAISMKVKESTKFSEACWKIVFYICSWTSGVYIVYLLGIFVNTKKCWYGWPDITIEPMVYHYYMFQLGFYCHSLYAHFAYEVKRSDFWPLLLHHFVTIFLIHFSYVVGFHRVGLLVLICHDINDIIFELGKTYVYREKEPHTTITFVMIMIVWVISRLTIFPFVVIKSTIFEIVEFIPFEIAPFLISFNISLLFLLGLHIYWFYLMINMAFRVLTGREKGVVDSRETETSKSK